MTTILQYLIVFLVIASVPVRAAARCEGAVVLGAFHDAYRATLNERGPGRRHAAMSLLVIAGSQDEAAFARQVARSGVDVSEERLGEVLSDARQFATSALKKDIPADQDFRHGQNVQWLEDIFLASRCHNSLATTSRSNVEGTSRMSGRGDLSPASKLPVQSQLPFLAGFLVAAILIAVVVYKFNNSFTMRRMRVQRMPRVPVVLPLRAEYAFPDGEIRQIDVEAVDISQGGMKLSWSKPPGPGTHTTVYLFDDARAAQITWSNSFYAGIMFANPLSDTELKKCLEMSQPLPA